MAFDFGHLRSQKFAALVFCVFVIFVAAFALTAAEVFSTLVMGVVALYTAFVGGRSYSDAQALKAGLPVNTVDASKAPATTTKKAAIVAAPKEKDNEVD